MKLRGLSVVLLAFSLFFLAFPVYALTLKTVTITAEEFNAAYISTTGVFGGCKSGYDGNLSEWTATITQNLVLNSTEYGAAAGICFSSQNYTGQAAGTDSFSIYFYFDGWRIRYANATGSWVYYPSTTHLPYSPPVKIVYKNQAISVWSGDTFIGNFTLYAHVTPKYILYKVNLQNLVLSGQATITISSDLQIGRLVDVVVQLIPAFLIIGMLGVAFAMMKRAMT